jgi:hypothetical protein
MARDQMRYRFVNEQPDWDYRDLIDDEERTLGTPGTSSGGSKSEGFFPGLPLEDGAYFAFGVRAAL